MADSGGSGAFIQTTQIWDASTLRDVDVTSPQFKELLVRMYQNLSIMAHSVNGKDAAVYDTKEFACGQMFFPLPGLTSSSSTTATHRPVLRKVINFGALPNAAAKTAAHGIAPNTSFIFTRIYGTSSDTTNRLYIPLPYASSVAANNIEVSVDATNVTITTGKDMTAYTVTYVILEYLKS